MTRARIVTTSTDRLAALRVAHAATQPEQPFEAYAAIRFRVPRRREADWWLLETDDGVPATSLMSYPLQFARGSVAYEGFGIGAVATHPEHRGRGCASELCAAVTQDAAERGRPLGLLFSAIPPGLYERLGFVVAPAYGWRATDLEALSRVNAAMLTPVDGMREADTLAALYEAAHVGLHLHRNAEAFRRSCVRNAEDLFFTVGSPARGYLRLYLEDADEVEIAEFVVPETDEREVLAAVFDLAVHMKRPSVVGWMPPTPAIEALFAPRPRSKTLPMVRGHDALERAMFWSSDYF